MSEQHVNYKACQKYYLNNFIIDTVAKRFSTVGSSRKLVDT